jgi:hypothetical protein
VPEARKDTDQTAASRSGAEHRDRAQSRYVQTRTLDRRPVWNGADGGAVRPAFPQKKSYSVENMTAGEALALLPNPPATQPRGVSSMSSIGLGSNPLLQDKIFAQALNSRDEGLLIGVTLLSRMTVDWEELGWTAVKTGVNTALSIEKPKWGSIGSAQPKLSNTSNQYVQNIVLQGVGGEVLGFLQKAVNKAVDRISKSKWFARAKKVIGLGFDVLKVVVNNMIASIPVIQAVIPFWTQIKGVFGGIDSVLKTVDTRGDLALLESDKDLIGQGVPSIALNGFTSYVRREMLLWAGKSAYQFGKSLAGILGTIFAAHAMSTVNMVTAIVEAVYSFVSALYQACCFESACKKCGEYLISGKYIDEFGETFNSIVAACPLIGAFFFGLKQRIGGINLTCMLQDFHHVISDSSLQMAMATKVCDANLLACKYIVGLNFKPKARSGAYADEVNDALEMIQATAATGQVQTELKMSKARKIWNKISNFLK